MIQAIVRTTYIVKAPPVDGKKCAPWTIDAEFIKDIDNKRFVQIRSADLKFVRFVCRQKDLTLPFKTRASLYKTQVWKDLLAKRWEAQQESIMIAQAPHPPAPIERVY